MGSRSAPTLAGPRPGLVTDWIEFSAVDGPGNRFVLFLQGCTFDCVACHNPYTINPCLDCLECVATCPSGALAVDGAGHLTWDEAACSGAEACVSSCPYDSTPKARRLAVDDVLALLRPAAPFLSGVTVSGGEATRQVIFLRELFLTLRADPELGRLTRFVDTNGDVNAPIWEVLCPIMDAAMVDLKCLDNEIHRRLTGVDNTKVLATIANLAGRGKLHEVRLLMLPGHNDSDELVTATGRWLARIDPRMRVKVIGFRHHGVRPTSVPLLEPSPQQLAHYRDLLAAQGDFDLVVI
ncbi:MAG: YjjW family glycine radical enzyme activase [Propionicimonas sp.]|nr:YjjW family glycine radical enzyme activase [Propionicimonas sp.]